jgi:hypothetical protein
MDPWKTRLLAELSHGEAARQRGNEGQARVCARRAAGIAIREHAARQGRVSTSASVMHLFEDLRQDPSTPPFLLPIIAHLSQPVDTSFRLPPGMDLLEEARSLIDALLPDWRETD